MEKRFAFALDTAMGFWGERLFFSLCSSAKNFQLVPPFLLFPKLYFSSFLWQKRSKESLFCWLPQKWYSSSVIKFSDSEKLHMAQKCTIFAVQYKNTVFKKFPAKSHFYHFWIQYIFGAILNHCGQVFRAKKSF